MASFAEYERAKIKERTLRGKREKARKGLVPAGRAPYGYRYDHEVSGKLIVHDVEAGIVRQVYRWLVESGMSLRGIVTELKQHGVRMSRSQVRRLLTSEVYAGRAYFDQRQRVKGKAHRFRPESEWISIPVPAIVSADTWQRALAQLRRN